MSCNHPDERSAKWEDVSFDPLHAGSFATLRHVLKPGGDHALDS